MFCALQVNKNPTNYQKTQNTDTTSEHQKKSSPKHQHTSYRKSSGQNKVLLYYCYGGYDQLRDIGPAFDIGPDIDIPAHIIPLGRKEHVDTIRNRSE